MSRHAYPAIATQGSRTAVYVATRENPAGDGSGAQTGGRLYALSADLSTIYWAFQREHPFHAAPVVSNETVYIGNDDGYLYALDTTLPEEL